ncbi:MAG: cupin domain-containing protein [Acidobacteriota bacterium]
MATPATPFVTDLLASVQFAERGIVSKTLHDSAALKVVLFCFEPGQALSEHTAPFEAVIQVVQGKGKLRLGEEEYEGRPGSLFVMPAGLRHAVAAEERLVFLLTMVRAQAPVALR